MRIDPIHYLEASSCRIDSARKLHMQARYSDAIYLAGVSVECLLRAFITYFSNGLNAEPPRNWLFVVSAKNHAKRTMIRLI